MPGDYGKKVVYMTPEEFLRLGGFGYLLDAPSAEYDRMWKEELSIDGLKRVNSIERKLREKRPIDPPYVDFGDAEHDPSGIQAYGGVHRALAARSLRIDRIPVVVGEV